MAITPELLRYYDVDEKKIKKIFGPRSEVAKIVIKVPNGTPNAFEERIARNENQVESWLGTPGADVVT